MRDTLKPESYWLKLLAQKKSFIAEDYAYMNNTEENNKIRGRSADMYITGLFEIILAKFSAGINIPEIIVDAKQLLCEAYPKYIKDFPGNTRYGATRPTYPTINRYFALLILSNPSDDEAKKFINAYDHWDYTASPVPGHRDHICEAMVAYFKHDKQRPKSTGVNWPEAYDPLWLAIAPNTHTYARQQYVKTFLENWYSEMASELAANTETHQSKHPYYFGYWCLEAAAAVVMRDIDDTSFRTHKHYPADMVDWAREHKHAQS